MTAFHIRNVAANAAKQRQLGEVETAAKYLAQAISNALRPDPAKVAEIKAAFAKEHQRCENLRKPVSNARDRSHLAPSAEEQPSTTSKPDRASLAPKGE